MKHILNVGLGKITTNKKGSHLNTVIINDKTFRYNKDKPLTQTLKHTLPIIEKSNKYKTSTLLNQASDKQENKIGFKKVCYRTKCIDNRRRECLYTLCNAYSISNIKLRGLGGLTYLRYQEDRLKQFLNKNTGMKVLIQVGIIITSEADTDDEDNHVRKVSSKVEDLRYYTLTIQQM